VRPLRFAGANRYGRRGRVFGRRHQLWRSSRLGPFGHGHGEPLHRRDFGPLQSPQPATAGDNTTLSAAVSGRSTAIVCMRSATIRRTQRSGTRASAL